MWVFSVLSDLLSVVPSFHSWIHCSKCLVWSLDLLVADGFWSMRFGRTMMTFMAIPWKVVPSLKCCNHFVTSLMYSFPVCPDGTKKRFFFHLITSSYMSEIISTNSCPLIPLQGLLGIRSIGSYFGRRSWMRFSFWSDLSWDTVFSSLLVVVGVSFSTTKCGATLPLFPSVLRSAVASAYDFLGEPL